MIYYKEYTLKNGDKLIVRNALVSEAQKIADIANITHEETKFLSFSREERTFNKEDEEKYIETMNESEDSLLLVADYNGALVATSQIAPKSKYKWKRHVAAFGVGVIKKYWGLGIAGKLMSSIIDVANSYGYEQIELTVVSENTKAFNLYKSFGFEVVGTLKNAYKYSPTHYADLHVMTKFL